jgi:hypothetical protein
VAVPVSLSPAEQRLLDSIEDGLAAPGSDLARLLATFGRLTAGEDMPAREQIPPPHRWRRRGGESAAHRTAWRNLAVLLWLTTAVTLITVGAVLGGRPGAGEACPGLPAAACIWQAPVRAVGAAVNSLVFRL